MFDEILNNHGFTLLWDNEYGQFCFKSDTHLILIYQWDNMTRVDPIESHDRWAIAEHEFDFVPYSEEQFEQIAKKTNIK